MSNEDTEIDQIKEVLRKKREEEVSPLRPKGMLSSGSTLLNLACTDNPFRAFMRGGFYLVPGDSDSGKTVLGSTCLAEAAMNPKFNDYRLTFDNVENGALFFDKFYGPRIAARIKSPRKNDKGEWINSRKVQDFYYNAHDLLLRKPNVLVLDSEQALSSEQEQAKFLEKKKADEKGQESSGSYGDGKAKYHSENLRQLIAQVRETDSIVIMLTGTRDNLGFGAMFEPKSRPGGKALKFYAQLEIWFSIKKRITRTVGGETYKIGIIAQIQVKRNRFTGKSRTVEVPIYNSFGIDDLGSCVDWLVSHKHWKATEGKIKAPEFEFLGGREKLVRLIEGNNAERDLRVLTGKVWNEIEDQLVVHRKPRYA